MTIARARIAAGVRGRGVASDYAAALLGDLEVAVQRLGGPPDLHPALAWARSGAMALSGPAGGPPLLAPTPLASCAEGSLRALQALAPNPGALALDATALLGERAALFGLTRRGSIAPGGGCHLLPCRDGSLAVNLPRQDDLPLLPAWLECALPCGGGPPWEEIAAELAGRSSAEMLERARWLGLAVAPAAAPPADPPPWLQVVRHAAPVLAQVHPPRVLDLSSLWAGPLATSLLASAGAHVVKVESTTRPDGARSGDARFFDLLNAGKRSVALDLTQPEGAAGLRGLLEVADMVVESARPRALRQLGVEAEQWVSGRPGRTWLSITGYGRKEPEGSWVAFGDDAAAAAGLADAATPQGEAPAFVGDAIADPLTGLHAAAAALACHRAGGGVVVALALRDVVAHGFGHGGDAEAATVEHSDGRFRVHVGGAHQQVLSPRARAPRAPASPLGADNEALLADSAC